MSNQPNRAPMVSVPSDAALELFMRFLTEAEAERRGLTLEELDALVEQDAAERERLERLVRWCLEHKWPDLLAHMTRRQAPEGAGGIDAHARRRPRGEVAPARREEPSARVPRTKGRRP